MRLNLKSLLVWSACALISRLGSALLTPLHSPLEAAGEYIQGFYVHVSPVLHGIKTPPFRGVTVSACRFGAVSKVRADVQEPDARADKD